MHWEMSFTCLRRVHTTILYSNMLVLSVCLPICLFFFSRFPRKLLIQLGWNYTWAFAIIKRRNLNKMESLACMIMHDWLLSRGKSTIRAHLYDPIFLESREFLFLEKMIYCFMENWDKLTFISYITDVWRQSNV